MAMEPDTGNDPILALYRNYFVPTIRCFELANEARQVLEKATASQQDGAFERYKACLPLWVSMLSVTLEGYQAIGCRYPGVDAHIEEVARPLRTVRTHTANYYGDAEQKIAHSVLYDHRTDLIQKVLDIHFALYDFFHDYVATIEERMRTAADT